MHNLRKMHASEILLDKLEKNVN